MKKNNAKIVREGYNRIGSVYNKWAESVRTEERRKYVQKVNELLVPGAKVLDIGCGNGLLTTLPLAVKFSSRRQAKR